MTKVWDRPSHPFPKDHGDGPFWQAPFKGKVADNIDADTYSTPGENFLTGRLKQKTVTYIVVDDEIPPGEFKRYTRYVVFPESRMDYTAIKLVFKGSSTSAYKVEDLLGDSDEDKDDKASGGKNRTQRRRQARINRKNKGAQKRGSKDPLGNIVEAINTVGEILSDVSPYSNYRIELNSLTCENSCSGLSVDGNNSESFTFNNYGFKELQYGCSMGKNAIVSFDIINTNKSQPILVSFNVSVQTVR